MLTTSAVDGTHRDPSDSVGGTEAFAQFALDVRDQSSTGATLILRFWACSFLVAHRQLLGL